ncbi:efflux RND transporter periplasmic adaptor subunit [Methylibium rhizosphaerae]|uniref:efflux RND transporter periplasmic adaptor subunit n=1 Tax=Methylibium rhizosphaerae TaxID=2570323 RepID=UPI001126A812|nr:efflux RND transporter periplasmic adaptor subunit [Methylibium rhizosphaerae]
MKYPKRILVAATVSVALLAAAGLLINARASRKEEAPEPARPALTVTLETPQRLQLAQQFSAHGSVAAWQEASIGAEVPGLRLVAVHVNVGDVVRRGQVLATYDADTTAAELAQIRAAVAEAEAAAADAQANAERARSMQESGALSAQQIHQYLTAEQTAQARVEAQRAAARAQALRLARTQVLAPDDGVISARNATVGAVTGTGQELFRLIRGGRLEWRAEVTSAELTRLSPGTPARIAAADGSQVEGTVRMVAPTVDAHTRSGLVYVDLPAKTPLKAGMFAQGEFLLGQTPALTVPQQALVVRDGFSYLFRVSPDHRVVQTRVTTGRRSGQRVEVVEGLQPDAMLVAAGAGFLSDGDLVKVTQAPAAAGAAPLPARPRTAL